MYGCSIVYIIYVHVFQSVQYLYTSVSECALHV